MKDNLRMFISIPTLIKPCVPVSHPLFLFLPFLFLNQQCNPERQGSFARLGLYFLLAELHVIAT